MDKFQAGEDTFCTADGRAQNRIPTDLSQTPVQQGTVMNATMLNGLVFEIVNAIQMSGIKPDRSKENQLSQAIIYNNVGRISRWSCQAQHLPNTEVVLLGGTLNPADFEDRLETLKERCPHLVQADGTVLLPNYNRHYGVMDIARSLGDVQGDAIRNITGQARVMNRNSSQGGAITVSGQGDGFGGGGHGWERMLYFDASLAVPTAEENRPKNINELHTVCAGVPKKRHNPKTFFLADEEGYDTGQTITLYQGESGGYLGLNGAIMLETQPDPRPSATLEEPEIDTPSTLEEPEIDTPTTLEEPQTKGRRR